MSNRTERRSWREQLRVMNLVLPIMEIEAIGESLRQAGALGRALLGLLGRLRKR